MGRTGQQRSRSQGQWNTEFEERTVPDGDISDQLSLGSLGKKCPWEAVLQAIGLPSQRWVLLWWPVPYTHRHKEPRSGSLETGLTSKLSLPNLAGEMAPP